MDNMTWNILRDTIPARLCDAVAAPMIGSIFGSAITAGASMATNSQNLSWQTNENKKNREYSSEEAQKNRDFSSSEADKQREWQSSEWQTQFNQQRDEWYNQLRAQYGAQWDQYLKEMEYNSPKNQVGRMQDAGLNASAVLGANLGGLSSAAHLSAAGTPASPSGGTVSGAAAAAPGTPSPLMAGNPGLQNPFSQFGSTIKDIAEAASKIGTLKPMAENLAASAVEHLSNSSLRKSMNEWQELQNDYFKATKDKQMQRLNNDLTLQLVDIKLKQSQGELVDAQTLYTIANEMVARAETKLKDNEAALFGLNVATYMDQLTQSINESNSRIRANNASAANNSAQAARTESLLPFEVSDAELENIFNRAVQSDKILGAIEQMKQAGYVNDKLYEEMRNLRQNTKASSNEDKRRWISLVTGILLHEKAPWNASRSEGAKLLLELFGAVK